MLPELIKNEIIENLRPLNPEKVILFGSYAYGSPTNESDIDLYIVTKDNYFPSSFSEKMDLKIKISDMLGNLRNQMAVDIIVHTIPMHQRFIELESSFAKMIVSQGIPLI
jgi:predicted nucleotidyltransferase